MDEFTTTDIYGVPIHDYEKLDKLSDQEFALWYIAKMSRYWWWNQGIKPTCWECHQVIEKPKDLRRYCGKNLHPSCFSRIYSEEDILFNKEDRRYLDRVAAFKTDF